MSLTIYIKKNDKGRFHWTIEVHNHEKIATSGGTYETEAMCRESLLRAIQDSWSANIVDETGEKAQILGRAENVIASWV
jgi:uncharacterized protein YegP (UPF0339 family)